tara:strand:+ start:900 stop:1028 length:129 start_codon:yes stop_codon:yes gene_type:complete
LGRQSQQEEDGHDSFDNEDVSTLPAGVRRLLDILQTDTKYEQ